MRVIVAVLCALVVASQAANLVEKANQLGLTTLIKALELAKLSDTIAKDGPFTIFAPTNKAFDDLPDEIRTKLMNNMTLLTEVLEYHVIKGKVLSHGLTNEQLAPTLQGKNIRINIYSMERVHPAQKIITASGRKVIKPDQVADNGVIHIVDKVLMPPHGTITDVISGSRYFSTLKTAVVAAGLADTLAGPGPFTLFAPDDKAFSKIPKDELEALLKNKEKLTEVLKFHVVAGTWYSPGLIPEKVLTTLEGEKLNIVIDNAGGVTINEKSKVEYPDLPVTNGVIHAIDTVLMPKSHDWHPHAGSFEALLMKKSTAKKFTVL